MPTDSAPMVIALGEAYTGGDKGLPQNAVAARKSTARPDPPRPSGPPVPRRSPLALDVQKGAITMVDLLDGLVDPSERRDARPGGRERRPGRVSCSACTQNHPEPRSRCSVPMTGFSVSLPPPRPSSTLLRACVKGGRRWPRTPLYAPLRVVHPRPISYPANQRQASEGYGNRYNTVPPAP